MKRDNSDNIISISILGATAIACLIMAAHMNLAGHGESAKTTTEWRSEVITLKTKVGVLERRLSRLEERGQ